MYFNNFKNPQLLKAIAQKHIKDFRHQKFRVYYQEGEKFLYFYRDVQNISRFHFVSNKITPIKIWESKYVVKGCQYKYYIIYLYKYRVNITKCPKNISIENLIKSQEKRSPNVPTHHH